MEKFQLDFCCFNPNLCCRLRACAVISLTDPKIPSLSSLLQAIWLYQGAAVPFFEPPKEEEEEVNDPADGEETAAAEGQAAEE